MTQKDEQFLIDLELCESVFFLAGKREKAQEIRSCIMLLESTHAEAECTDDPIEKELLKMQALRLVDLLL